MIDYEVGQIPARPVGLIIKNEDDNFVSLAGYDGVIELEMLDTDNKPVDLTGTTVQLLDPATASYVVTWPKDRTLFGKPGQYLIRLALRKSDGSVDYTRPKQITVRKFGRVNN